MVEFVNTVLAQWRTLWTWYWINGGFCEHDNCISVGLCEHRTGSLADFVNMVWISGGLFENGSNSVADFAKRVLILQVLLKMRNFWLNIRLLYCKEEWVCCVEWFIRRKRSVIAPFSWIRYNTLQYDTIHISMHIHACIEYSFIKWIIFVVSCRLYNSWSQRIVSFPSDIWKMEPNFLTRCFGPTLEQVRSTRSSRATHCSRHSVMLPAEIFEVRKDLLTVFSAKVK